MDKEKLLIAFVNSIPDPVVIADTGHMIVHANRAADTIMGKNGPLEGRHLFDCHNENSKRILNEVLEKLKGGNEEVQITDRSEGKQRTFMRAIRDSDGKLIGYYERYIYWPKRID